MNLPLNNRELPSSNQELLSWGSEINISTSLSQQDKYQCHFNIFFQFSLIMHILISNFYVNSYVLFKISIWTLGIGALTRYRLSIKYIVCIVLNYIQWHSQDFGSGNTFGGRPRGGSGGRAPPPHGGRKIFENFQHFHKKIAKTALF